MAGINKAEQDRNNQSLSKLLRKQAEDYAHTADPNAILSEATGAVGYFLGLAADATANQVLDITTQATQKVINGTHEVSNSVDRTVNNLASSVPLVDAKVAEIRASLEYRGVEVGRDKLAGEKKIAYEDEKNKGPRNTRWFTGCYKFLVGTAVVGLFGIGVREAKNSFSRYLSTTNTSGPGHREPAPPINDPNPAVPYVSPLPTARVSGGNKQSSSTCTTYEPINPGSERTMSGILDRLGGPDAVNVYKPGSFFEYDTVNSKDFLKWTTLPNGTAICKVEKK